MDLEFINVKFYFTSCICWGFLFFILLLLLIVFVMFRVAFLALLQLKILGYIRICHDTNKVGFIGILQPFRDAIKLFSLDVSCLLS